MSKHPGSSPNSYGYHADDGKAYHGGVGVPFGLQPNLDVYKYGAGDTVGAGVNHDAQEIFFTKNGRLIGTVFHGVRITAYPTIGLHSPREKVEVNLGRRPFLFDVEALMHEERDKRMREVELVGLPPSIGHGLVKSYLAHYGYLDTLEALEPPEAARLQGGAGAGSSSANGHADAAAPESRSLEQRKVIRQLIGSGQIDKAMSQLREWFPQVWEDPHSHVEFLLCCQKFIELVQLSQVDEAVEFARQTLKPFCQQSARQDAHLQDCLALLAYEQPMDSPLQHLIGHAQREVVADFVNAAILAVATQKGGLMTGVGEAKNGEKMLDLDEEGTRKALHDVMLGSSIGGVHEYTALEFFVRHLTVCLSELRDANGGHGEVFQLRKVVKGDGHL